jgi:hypothetical protein
MAAMAGNVDDLGAVADFVQGLDVLEIHAVVQPVPQPPQHRRHEADEALGGVRGDFQGMLAGREQGGAARQAAHLHFAAHRGAHVRGLQQLRHQGAAVREIRADGRGALCAQAGAEVPQHPAHAALLAHAFLHRVAQPQRLAEVHQGVAAVDQHAQKFAEAPDQYPVFGEQQAPQTHLFARRAAPENRHRHEIHVVLGIGGCRGHELDQVARSARAQLEAGLLRGWQAELGANHAEHRQVRLALALQDVAHGPRPRREHGGGIVGFDGHPHPSADELADQPVPSLAQVRSLGANLAALLLVDCLARLVRLIHPRVLHVAGTLFRLQHGIEDGLFGRRLGRGATKDEQNRK